MLEVLRHLWTIASNARKVKRSERDGKMLVYDPNGNQLWVDVEDLQAAINAELIDAAAVAGKNLVYEEGWEWPIDLKGLRAIIAIAHHEENPDLALLDVVLARGFHEYGHEEEDEDTN